jgi:hypothetical protein
MTRRPAIAAASLAAALFAVTACDGRSEEETKFLHAATAHAPGVSEDALLQGAHQLCDANGGEKSEAEPFDFLTHPGQRFAVIGDAVKYLCPLSENNL